ncbi:MAG: hypothetical protein GDA48_15855 [Hormoscilla sp. GM102CHS1]|nr:hypothetical protein [Hormoscilla sp. GM102CHS1]
MLPSGAQGLKSLLRTVMRRSPVQRPSQIGSTGGVVEGKPEDRSSKNNDKLGRYFSQFTRYVTKTTKQ